MLDEYSIEQRATQIFDARSKEYFSEVLSCYAAGNHRSAVVMLWPVVVCDLLFKLQHLVDLYGDDKAKTILAEFYITAGHRVFGCARSGAAISELRMTYPEHHFSVVDIAFDHDVARWSADIFGHHGTPDLLINNAGLMCRTAPLWKHSNESFTQLLDTREFSI